MVVVMVVVVVVVVVMMLESHGRVFDLSYLCVCVYHIVCMGYMHTYISIYYTTPCIALLMYVYVCVCVCVHSVRTVFTYKCVYIVFTYNKMCIYTYYISTYIYILYHILIYTLYFILAYPNIYTAILLSP